MNEAKSSGSISYLTSLWMVANSRAFDIKSAMASLVSLEELETMIEEQRYGKEIMTDAYSSSAKGDRCGMADFGGL